MRSECLPAQPSCLNTLPQPDTGQVNLRRRDLAPLDSVRMAVVLVRPRIAFFEMTMRQFQKTVTDGVGGEGREREHGGVVDVVWKCECCKLIWNKELHFPAKVS